MSEPKIHAGHYYTQQADGSWKKGAPVSQQMPRDPTFDYQGPQAAAQAQNTTVDAQVNAATAPAQVRTANAQATVAENEAAATQVETEQFLDAQQAKSLRSAYRTDAVLNAIRNARSIARSEGGTGWESLLSGLPATSARKLESELAPILGNLSFDRLQEMREESKTGGALGAVSERELSLLGSTVASLDAGVDTETFLRRLDAIERHFIGAQLAASGVDPDSEQGRAAFKNDFGYTGVFEGETPQGSKARVGANNADETRVTIPDAYQQEHLRYLRDNWGRVDPANYVRFRTALDERFELTPDLNAYAEAAPSFNAAAQQGATPEQLGSVPAASRDMGMIEQGLNKAVQSAPGAFFANATNSFAAGLPARFGGGQEQLEALREARPYSSMAGEMVGAGAGAVALGGGAAQFGGRAGAMMGNPFASELAHSTIYGATQDDNALRGAGMGAVGSLAGSAIGRQIGGAFPETFAGGAVRQADESVPSIDELRDIANVQYRDVEAAGVRAMPDQTRDLYKRAQDVLRGEAKMTPKGRMTQIDGKTAEAMRLLKDYSGEMMTPTQAQSVRKSLSDGMASADPSEQRISGLLMRDFDQWADPVLPGIDVPRATSQRYLQGQQLQQRAGIANIRGQRMKGNDVGDAYRTQFGQVDEAVNKGQAYFDQPTTDAIARAARGDTLTNGLRAVGKYGLGNPLTSGGIGIGGGAAVLGQVDPIYATAALGTGLFGSGARKLAEKRTVRAAQEAELTALGGEDYLELLRKAEEVAKARAGRAVGGATGAAASGYSRPEWQPQ